MHIIELREMYEPSCDCDIDDDCDCSNYPHYFLVVNGKTGHGGVETTDDGYVVNFFGACFTVNNLKELADHCKVSLSCFGEIKCDF